MGNKALYFDARLTGEHVYSYWAILEHGKTKKELENSRFFFKKEWFSAKRPASLKVFGGVIK